MLASSLNFQQFTKFHWDHKWIVVKFVSFFVVSKAWDSFPHAISHWGRTEQWQAVWECQTTGGSATTTSRGCGPHQLWEKQPSLWNPGLHHGSFDFLRKSHPAFLGTLPQAPGPLLWATQYAEITLSEKIRKMRKDSRLQRERVCQVWDCHWYSVQRLYKHARLHLSHLL